MRSANHLNFKLFRENISFYNFTRQKKAISLQIWAWQSYLNFLRTFSSIFLRKCQNYCYFNLLLFLSGNAVVVLMCSIETICYSYTKPFYILIKYQWYLLLKQSHANFAELEDHNCKKRLNQILNDIYWQCDKTVSEDFVVELCSFPQKSGDKHPLYPRKLGGQLPPLPPRLPHACITE